MLFHVHFVFISLIHSWIHSLIHSLADSWIESSFTASFIDFPIHWLIASWFHWLPFYSFIHALSHLSMHSFIHSFIHSFVYSFMHACMHESVRNSFIHSLINSFLHSFTPSFLHSFIHSFMALVPCHCIGISTTVVHSLTLLSSSYIFRNSLLLHLTYLPTGHWFPIVRVRNWALTGIWYIQRVSVLRLYVNMWTDFDFDDDGLKMMVWWWWWGGVGVNEHIFNII